uniref:Rho-GAP domain-containing protein n=1 Tax=Amphiprion percula TaxID=161767 RepID=A0A3P8SIE5_AMPPE
MLSKVQDVHVVCGFLKDVLRKLKEPLLTFRLHRTFMEAAELADADSCSAIMVQNVSELPKANRDTLAFLMLHLHKVIRSPHCQMDQNNLARVFGPTIVGHGMSEPSPTTIMRDTNTQPKVVLRLLSLPEDYWRRILTIQTDQGPSSSSTFKMNQEETHGVFPCFKSLLAALMAAGWINVMLRRFSAILLPTILQLFKLSGKQIFFLLHLLKDC